MPYIHRNDIVDIELNRAGNLFRSFANRMIGEGDSNGNVFGFRLFRDGVKVDLSDCAVNGYFIRADGSTVVMNGAVNSSGVAYVRLPASCYTVEGNFSLAIKITGGDEAGTMRIVDGTVVNTTTGTIIDPGSVVPDLADLMAVIERAETAAATIGAYSIEAVNMTGTRYKISVVLPEEED